MLQNATSKLASLALSYDCSCQIHLNDPPPFFWAEMQVPYWDEVHQRSKLSCLSNIGWLHLSEADSAMQLLLLSPQVLRISWKVALHLVYLILLLQWQCHDNVGDDQKMTSVSDVAGGSGTPP